MRTSFTDLGRTVEMSNHTPDSFQMQPKRGSGEHYQGHWPLIVGNRLHLKAVKVVSVLQPFRTPMLRIDSEYRSMQ